MRSDFYLVDRGRFYDSTVRGLAFVSRLCGSEANTHGEFPGNGICGNNVARTYPGHFTDNWDAHEKAIAAAIAAVDPAKLPRLSHVGYKWQLTNGR